MIYEQRRAEAEKIGHEYANWYPVITDGEFTDLVESVRASGVREPVVMFEGKVLDGRNRWLAAQAAEIVHLPRREFNPDAEGDPLVFVKDLNWNRRHLNEMQKGLIAARTAAERRGSGSRGTSTNATGAPVALVDSPNPTRDAARATKERTPSRAERAESVGVSRDTLERSDKVLDRGIGPLHDIAKAGNVSVKTAATIATLDPEKQEEIIAAARARTGGNEEKLAKALQTEAANAVKRDKHEGIARGNRLADPDGVTYDVGVADPPWKYEGEGVRGEAAGHYPTMTIREICAWSPVKGVPIRDLFAKNAVLFLWTTVHNVWRRGLAYGDTDELAGNTVDVADAWGFPDFRGCFVWVKPHYGMGQWARNQYEHLAIFTRGTFPTPPTTAVVSNVLQGDAWPLSKHSEKPPATYDLIERMTPGDYRRVEFFARSSAPGWKGFGNQVPSQK